MNRKTLDLIAVFIIAIAIIAAIVSTTIIVKANSNNITPIEPIKLVATISEANIPSEASFEEVNKLDLEVIQIERVNPITPKEAEDALRYAEERNASALAIYNGLKNLGYGDEHSAVKLALAEVNNTTEDYKYYINKQKEISQKWEKKKSEYPIATQVWLYMKDEFGWNDIVCAGIMGNMMAECGGCWTADLDWNVDTEHGLGMIQWIGSRKKLLVETYGKVPTVEEQLLFMKDELYGTNGIEQQVSFEELNEIMNASTPEECAFAFATYYERCAKKYRAPRKDYAKQAYDYFVN